MLDKHTWALLKILKMHCLIILNLNLEFFFKATIKEIVKI